VASYSGQSPLWRFVTLHYPPPQKEKGKGNSVAFYFLQKNEDEVFTKKKRQNLITGKVWISPRKWLVDICAYQTIEN
jgi:hypothetical protein